MNPLNPLINPEVRDSVMFFTLFGCVLLLLFSGLALIERGITALGEWRRNATGKSKAPR